MKKELNEFLNDIGFGCCSLAGILEALGDRTEHGEVIEACTLHYLAGIVRAKGRQAFNLEEALPIEEKTE